MDPTIGPQTQDGEGPVDASGAVATTAELNDDADLAWDRFLPERDDDHAGLDDELGDDELDETGYLETDDIEDADSVAEDLELRWDVFEVDARDADDDEKSARFEAVLERMAARAQRHAEGEDLDDIDMSPSDGDVMDSSLLADADAADELLLIDDGDEDALGDVHVDAVFARLEDAMYGTDGEHDPRVHDEFDHPEDFDEPDEPYDWLRDDEAPSGLPIVGADLPDAHAELDDALRSEAGTEEDESESVCVAVFEPESWLGDDVDLGDRADDEPDHAGEIEDADGAPALTDEDAPVLGAAFEDDGWETDAWESDVWESDAWYEIDDTTTAPDRSEEAFDAGSRPPALPLAAIGLATTTPAVTEPEQGAVAPAAHGADEAPEGPAAPAAPAAAMTADPADSDAGLGDADRDDAPVEGDDGLEVATRSRRRRHARTEAPNERRLILLALLFFLVVLAAVVLHFGRQSGGSPPVTAATSATSSQAQLARLESAIEDVQSASSGAQAELTTLTLFPTPSRVATVINPYVDSLHLYETLAATVTVPARAQAAAQATQTQVRSDMAFFRTVNGLPPIQLGAFISSFLARSTGLQQSMDTLQHALTPSAP